MADTFTGSFNFTQPEIGGSPDTWGTKLNGNWGSLDDLLAQFVGMVAAFPATGTVTGWLKMDGATVSRTTYARLYSFATTSGVMAASEGVKEPGEFGPGDGATTFSLPDLRGYTVRAWDDAAGVDTGRMFGTSQADQNKSHDHTGTTGSGGGHAHTNSVATAGGHTHTGGADTAGSHSHSGSTNTTGSHSHSATAKESASGSGSDFAAANNSIISSLSTESAGNHSHSLNINSNGSHSHNLSINSSGDHSHVVTIDAVAAHTHAFTTGTEGGSEARVKNVALTYYIKH